MNNEFIKNLKKALEQENMSQRALAEKIGCTEVSISRYLSGERVPKGPVIVNMAKALNVTPNFLLGFEEHRMTNADRIRNMTDEELANFLFSISLNEEKITICDEKCDECANDNETCIILIEKWLEEKVEE